MRAAVMGTVIGGRDDAEGFARAAEIGFSGVEVELGREELRATKTGRLEGLRRARRDFGLEIPALVLPEHPHAGGIADASPEAARAAQEDVRAAVAWAEQLGADVVLVPFFERSELTTEDDIDRAVAAFQVLCAAAAERGVTLCYEGTLSAGEILRLADRIGSDSFGCYFDLANPLAKRGLDGPTEIRALGGLVRRVHVKDTRVRTGDCRPGTGRIDFAESARALSEIGYDGWLTLETPPAPPPLIARDLSFTRAVFPEVEGGVPWPRLGAFSREFERGEWAQLADAFVDLGLGVVQLDGELLDECLEDPARAEAGRVELDARGIRIPALGGYRNLVAADPQVRRANIEHVSRCLDAAQALGCYVVATETGTLNPDRDWSDSPLNSTETAWTPLYEALEVLLPVAEKSGTILALEAHVAHVLKTRGQVDGLLERFPSQNLQLVCDPYNYVSQELVPVREEATGKLLDRFEDRFVLAHLKDVDAQGARAGTPEFGTGVFAQRPYLEFLRTRRPDLGLIAEHMPLAHVPVVRRRLDELGARYEAE